MVHQSTEYSSVLQKAPEHEQKIKKVKKLLEKEIDNIQTSSTCVQMHTLKILIIKMSRKNNVVRTRNKSSICGKIRGDDQEENVEYKM